MSAGMAQPGEIAPATDHRGHAVFFYGHDDELADSPLECGPDSSHSAHTFTAQGVEHELVVWGRGDFDARRASGLGFTAESSFDDIIRAHVEDELDGKLDI